MTIAQPNAVVCGGAAGLLQYQIAGLQEMREMREMRELQRIQQMQEAKAVGDQAPEAVCCGLRVVQCDRVSIDGGQ